MGAVVLKEAQEALVGVVAAQVRLTAIVAVPAGMAVVVVVDSRAALADKAASFFIGLRDINYEIRMD